MKWHQASSTRAMPRDGSSLWSQLGLRTDSRRLAIRIALWTAVVAAVMGIARLYSVAVSRHPLAVLALRAPISANDWALAVAIWSVGVIGLFGLTRREHDLQACVESERELQRAIFQSNGFGMILASLERRILDANQRACEMLGYDPERLIGESVDLLFGSNESFLEFAEKSEVQNASGTIAQDWPLKKGDGTVLWCTVSASLLDLNAPDRGYIWGLTDTSRLKSIQESLERSNAELLQARDAALGAARAKAEFLANMSHEIRTPLHGMLGTTELLQSTQLTKEQTSYLAIIARSGEGLLAILNDILDYSKVEAGQLQLERVRFSPGREVREAALLLGTRLDSSRVKLQVIVHDAVPQHVIGDGGRFRQIFSNLLNNAVKFTKDGSIRVQLSPISSEGHACRLALEVSDSGIGISPEQQTRLFRPFSQADSSTSRRYGGSGLGLMLVKRLTDAMGGSITLVSELNAGSSFRVELPFATDPSIEPANPPSRSGQNGSTVLRTATGLKPRILIAEDTLVSQMIAKSLLEKAGASTCVAASGHEAIESYQREQFDVVLMDCQMPEMDGYEATQAIRNLERLTKRHVPIIAMTAGAMAEDQQRCLEVGMDDYLSKPVSGESLLRRVRVWLEKSP